jgi:uncharacterized protein involved in exopolysaccharide biosynthesis
LTPLLAWCCHLLFRHKKKIALSFLLIMGIASAVGLLSPRSYRSQAKLFLRLGRENVTLDPTTTMGQTPVVAIPPNRDSEINSVIDMLKSNVLLEQVVAKMGADTILGNSNPGPEAPVDPAPRGESQRAAASDRTRSPWADDPPRPNDARYRATAQLAKMLDVEAIRKSNLIRISCEGSSPELARAIVACLIDLYLDQHVRLNRVPGALQFLSEQTARLRGGLSNAEEELRKLKDSTGLGSPEPQRQILVARIGRLQDELLQAEGGSAASEATTRLLREQVAAMPRTHVSAVTKGLPNMPADSMRGQLYALEVKEKELAIKYGERHSEVVRTRAQIVATRALLKEQEGDREQTTTGPNRLHEEAQLALLREEPVLAALKARAASLRAQLASERDRLQKLNGDQLLIARLQREVDLQEGHYRKYADNLEQIQIDGAFASERMSNISVVQPATYDAQPVRPRLFVTLGIGLLCAVVGGLTLALLCEHMDRTFKTPEEIQHRLGLPVLASLPCTTPELLTGNRTR